MTPTPRPAAYSEGYGELVRAYRYYMGVSQRTLAEKIGIGERSLADIETGRRACPPGFLDSVQKVIDRFNDTVRDLTVEADDWAATHNDELVIEVNSRDDWNRAVVGRSAYENGLIRPVLSSQRHP